MIYWDYYSVSMWNLSGIHHLPLAWCGGVLLWTERFLSMHPMSYWPWCWLSGFFCTLNTCFSELCYWVDTSDMHLKHSIVFYLRTQTKTCQACLLILSFTVFSTGVGPQSPSVLFCGLRWSRICTNFATTKVYFTLLPAWMWAIFKSLFCYFCPFFSCLVRFHFCE